MGVRRSDRAGGERGIGRQCLTSNAGPTWIDTRAIPSRPPSWKQAISTKMQALGSSTASKS